MSTLFSTYYTKNIYRLQRVLNTHLPESLPVTLSDKTHTHLVFLNIFIAFLLKNV